MMIADDFPDSDRADDAMFMAANTAIENLVDLSVGAAILEDLVELYPQSDLIDDATFILENLYNPKFRQPTSIEDIRR
jgi:TolA-binding protein